MSGVLVEKHKCCCALCFLVLVVCLLLFGGSQGPINVPQTNALLEKSVGQRGDGQLPAAPSMT